MKILNRVQLKLNYFWRLFGTASSFFLFGIGGLFMSLILFPVITACSKSRSESERKIKLLIHYTFQLYLWYMQKMGVLTLVIEGRERAVQDSGCLVLANHPSLIDVVILMSIYPRANCIVKAALWENLFLKGVVRGAGYVPNDGGEQVLQHCKSALDSGDSLIIFPEGTRTVPGQPIRMQRGASHISLRLQSDIRAVRIEVKPTTLTKSEKWYQIPAQKPLFRISLGEKLKISELFLSELPTPIAARRLTEVIQEKLESPLINM